MTRPSCCAPTRWARPTASSRSSPRSAGGSGRWPRACAAPSPGSGRGWSRSWSSTSSATRAGNLDTVTQAESLATYGADHRPRLHASTPPRTVMVETAERLTEEHEPSTQQYLLLAGGPALARRRRARPGARSRRLPAALARGRGLGAELPRLREVRGPRTALGLQHRGGRRGMPGVPPAGSAAPAPETLRPAGRAAQRGLGASPTPPTCARAARASGLVTAFLQWHLERGVALAAARRAHRPGLTGDAQPARYAAPFAHPSGARPPSIPAEVLPEARGHRHGRQRPLGQRPRTAADQGARGGRGLAARRRGRGHRGRRRPTCRRTRSPPRTGGARPTRCASSWASTAT